MINYNILAKERKEKGVTWGYLESCIGSGYRGKFVDFKKGKTSLTSDEEKLLAQALGVSVDYLSGKEKQKNKLSPKGESLNEKEKQLLAAFRNMTDIEQDSFLNIAAAASAKIAEEENK